MKLLTPRLPFRDTPDQAEVDHHPETEARERGYDDLQPEHGFAPGDGQLVGLEVPDFACASCGAGMDAGQDWCLECGTAAPGRIDERPGGRAALTIAGVVVALVLSAGVAAYAALATDAARQTQGADPNGQPLQAQVPQAPAPGAATNTPPRTPAVPSPLPKGGPGNGAQIPTPAPAAGGETGAPAPAPPSGGGAGPSPASGDGAGAPGGSSGGSGGAPATGAVGPIALAPGAGDVQFLNEGEERADARFGDPTKAYDGSDASVWSASVPADGDDFGLGLAFSLERPRDVRSVTLALDGRQGFSVQVFGSGNSSIPPDMLDRRWKKIGSDANVKNGDRLSLDADGGIRHVLVRITEASQGDEARRGVAIAEVRLRGR